MQQGEQFLEIHVDFDQLKDDKKYDVVYRCACGLVNQFTVYKNEVHLIKGQVFTCINCCSKAVVFGNHFEVKVNNE